MNNSRNHHPDLQKKKKKEKQLFNLDKKGSREQQLSKMSPLLKPKDDSKYNNGKTIGGSTKFNFPKDLDSKLKEKEVVDDDANFCSGEDGV